MPTRPGPIKLIVELVGKPGDRMGITCVSGRECPLHVRPVQTILNMDVFRDILVVVVVDELVPKCLTENDPDNCRKENTDDAGSDALTLLS